MNTNYLFYDCNKNSIYIIIPTTSSVCYYKRLKIFKSKLHPALQTF